MNGVFENEINHNSQIEKSDDEKLIKHYGDVAHLRTWYKLMKATLEIFVSDKRIICRAIGSNFLGKTTLQYEFDIHKIKGIDIRRDWRINWFRIIGCFLVSTVVSLVLIFFSAIIDIRIVPVMFALILLGDFLLAVVIIVIMFVFKGLAEKFLLLENLVMIFKTEGASPAIEICRDKNNLFGPKDIKYEYTGYHEVRPSKDTTSVVCELNAMISDIQTIGDYAIEKWQENSAVGHQNERRGYL